MSSSSWIGSIDVNDWVQKLLNKEVTAITTAANKGPLAQLNDQQNIINSKLSAYGTLQGYLGSLRTDLSAIINFQPGFSLGISNNSIANAEITGNAIQGIHTLKVSQLAAANTIASNF